MSVEQPTIRIVKKRWPQSLYAFTRRRMTLLYFTIKLYARRSAGTSVAVVNTLMLNNFKGGNERA
jgi:hypothetical protein